MNIKNVLIPYFILLFASHNAVAGKVYQWTDEEGVVHFSDVPPGDSTVTDTREIDIDIFTDNNIDEDRYSVINQVDRMAERRRKISEERLARKKLHLEEKRLALQQEYNRQNEIYSEEERYRPVYYAAYAEPYYLHQPRFGYHNNLRYPYEFKRHHPGFSHKDKFEYRGKLLQQRKSSIDHSRINKHHSKIAVKF